MILIILVHEPIRVHWKYWFIIRQWLYTVCITCWFWSRCVIIYVNYYIINYNIQHLHNYHALIYYVLLVEHDQCNHALSMLLHLTDPLTPIFIHPSTKIYYYYYFALLNTLLDFKSFLWIFTDCEEEPILISYGYFS